MGEKERPGRGKREVRKEKKKSRFLAKTGIAESVEKKEKKLPVSKKKLDLDMEEAVAEILGRVYGAEEPEAIAPSLDEKINRFFKRGETKDTVAKPLVIKPGEINKPIAPMPEISLEKIRPTMKEVENIEIPPQEKKEPASEVRIGRVASRPAGVEKVIDDKSVTNKELFKLIKRNRQFFDAKLYKDGDSDSDWISLKYPESEPDAAKGIKIFYGKAGEGEEKNGFELSTPEEFIREFEDLMKEYKPLETGKNSEDKDLADLVRNEEEDFAVMDEGDERERRSRSAARYTISRVKNFEELNADTIQEGNVKFGEKMKQFWKEFAVHGIISTDRETGKTVLNSYADLDGKTALGLLKLAGFDISNVKFVEPGKFEEGRINLDTGNEHGYKEGENGTAFVDHHSPESGKDSSTSKFVYQLLIDLGLLKDEKYLQKMVDFVTKEDNKEVDNENFESNFKDSWRTVLGLYKKMPFKHLMNFFKDGGNPISVLSREELKKYGLSGYGEKLGHSENRHTLIDLSLEKLAQMEKDGLIINSDRYGKIAVDIDKKVPLGYDAARAFGCGGYLIWNPATESFFLSTINPIQETFSQGINVRGKMWIKNQYGGEKLTTTLGEILNKITDGKLQPEGKLKEALEEEAEGKKVEDLSGIAEPKKHEREKFSKEENIFIDEVYLPTVRKHLERAESHYSEANGYLKEDIPSYIKGEMNRFWNKLREGMKQDGDIDEKSIGMAIEFLKETLNKK